MMSFARWTSLTPGSCTRIRSPVEPVSATIGSATPSALTRRSIVCSAWRTESRRSCTMTGSRRRNVYAPTSEDARECRARLVVCQPPEFGVLWLWHAVDAEARRVDDLNAAHIEFRSLSELAQTLRVVSVSSRSASSV